MITRTDLIKFACSTAGTTLYTSDLADPDHITIQLAEPTWQLCYDRVAAVSRRLADSRLYQDGGITHQSPMRGPGTYYQAVIVIRVGHDPEPATVRSLDELHRLGG